MAVRAKIPKNVPFTLSKASIIKKVKEIDEDKKATQRVLAMETGFRQKIKILSDNLPIKNSNLKALWTNPFVLIAHSFNKGYSQIFEIENDILIGKVFSFIETSVGRMVEEVVLPIYSWDVVASQMQSPYSVIDGELLSDDIAQFVTLKSGPRCINDSMVRGIADDIVKYYPRWAKDKNVANINFTIGILYGTYKKSQKKDWHILDEVRKSLEKKGIKMIALPDYRWNCSFSHDGINFNLNVKIGIDLWEYIGSSDKSFLEICLALVRACIPPSKVTPKEYSFSIKDLKDIISLEILPDNFNVSILQKSQFEWLFLVISHFCDDLISTDLDSVT